MINLVLFCLSTIGLTNIILDSSLFAPVRHFIQDRIPPKVYEVFECHQCMGTWCGFLMGGILLANNFFEVLACGFAGSFLATVAFLFIEYVSLKISNVTFDIPEESDEK